MNFTIITHVVHGQNENGYYGYGPYIREMNLWLKYVDKVTVVAPLQTVTEDPIYLFYEHNDLGFIPVKSFSFTSVKYIVKAFFQLPGNFRKLYRAMKAADHIHLRCPGNIALLGCVVQILFPKTPKTAKYAGNWDAKAKQPLSYRMQKWILNNTFLTRNMQVLVYGEWEGSSRNIKPFFTASYKEIDKHEVAIRKMEGTIRFLFVGTLSEGKRPMYAVRLVEQLKHLGHSVRLDLYGEGKERFELTDYIQKNCLQDLVFLHGNQTAEFVKGAYQNSHFLLLPSKSEGWPKVVAEAMFWSCVPVASAISCVSNMLDSGSRGVILSMEIQNDVSQLDSYIWNDDKYLKTAEEAMMWSRKYTLDYFETEIQTLL
ncbi:MAG TPA: glycosyltransferase [Flavobacterium sp.]|uniref:glycosyltransferase n=1 Tax=Flavobacterium sp. TaxID=239 RepID=UPI002C959F33|nr:glycosyltransferase [Flavobacterium sp.]HSD14409.1 glycosyltransferase [Flavobacterium sp.]